MTTQSDDFNRAGPGLGTNYTSPLAGHTISANAILGASAVDCRSYWSANAWGPKQRSSVTVGTVALNNQYCGATAKDSGTSAANYNGYEISTDGGSGATHTELARWDNGTQTVLTNFATTFVATDKLSIEVEPSGTHYLCRLFKNDVQVGADFDDATPPTGGNGSPGFATFNTATLDNWIGTDGTNVTSWADPRLLARVSRTPFPTFAAQFVAPFVVGTPAPPAPGVVTTADGSAAGDASGTVADSSGTQTAPLYPVPIDPRTIILGKLFTSPVAKAYIISSWILGAPAPAAQTGVVTADGSSTGTATAIAVGASTQTADFSSIAAATAIAVGAASQKADFSSAGNATAIAVGISSTTAVGQSTAGSGASTIAVGASSQSAVATSQAGSGSTTIAVGASSQKSDAVSSAGSGASTIANSSSAFSTADGSSAGSATAIATGASTASGDGLVIAGATAIAVSQSTQAAAASSAGSAAGTTADASPPSPPIVVVVTPTGVGPEGGGAAQKWMHAKGDKKRRMARIEKQDMQDIMELAQFVPQAQDIFAGRSNAAR